MANSEDKIDQFEAWFRAMASQGEIGLFNRSAVAGLFAMGGSNRVLARHVAESVELAAYAGMTAEYTGALRRLGEMVLRFEDERALGSPSSRGAARPPAATENVRGERADPRAEPGDSPPARPADGLVERERAAAEAFSTREPATSRGRYVIASARGESSSFDRPSASSQGAQAATRDADTGLAALDREPSAQETPSQRSSGRAAGAGAAHAEVASREPLSRAALGDGAPPSHDGVSSPSALVAVGASHEAAAERPSRSAVGAPAAPAVEPPPSRSAAQRSAPPSADVDAAQAPSRPAPTEDPAVSPRDTTPAGDAPAVAASPNAPARPEGDESSSLPSIPATASPPGDAPSADVDSSPGPPTAKGEVARSGGPPAAVYSPPVRGRGAFAAASAALVIGLAVGAASATLVTERTAPPPAPPPPPLLASLQLGIAFGPDWRERTPTSREQHPFGFAEGTGVVYRGGTPTDPNHALFIGVRRLGPALPSRSDGGVEEPLVALARIAELGAASRIDATGGDYRSDGCAEVVVAARSVGRCSGTVQRAGEALTLQTYFTLGERRAIVLLSIAQAGATDADREAEAIVAQLPP